MKDCEMNIFLRVFADFIAELEENEVFLFGSNIGGAWRRCWAHWAGVCYSYNARWSGCHKTACGLFCDVCQRVS